MNAFLQFKSKKHSEAYSHALGLQLKKRMVMLTAMTMIFVVIDVITYALNWKVGTLSSKLLVASRIIAAILAIMGIYCLKRNARKIQKYATILNFILDIIIAFIPFAFYPVLGNLSINSFTKLGVYTWAWSASLAVMSLNYIIKNWWMRIAVSMIQLGFFLGFAWKTEPLLTSLLLVVIEAFCLFLIMSYFHERYQRLDFYEKRKVYDNYEAIKKIFDDISQGIMIVDDKNQIIYSNQTVHSLFGETQGQQAATSLTSLFSQIQINSMFPRLDFPLTEMIPSLENEGDSVPSVISVSEALEGIKKTLFDENPLHNWFILETTLTSTHQNTNLSVKFTKSRFMEKQVLVVNITDNTDRDLLVAANASNEYKSRLLSSVSHELRTPLNGSINFTEQALNEPQIPKNLKDKWLLPALRSNQLLLSLVNDILDFSQMHAGKLRLVFESKSVLDTSKECIELVELQAKKKKLKLEFLNNLSLGEEMLMTDHNRLKQIMLNLLSNAVKFTFEGSVSLTLDPISSSTFSPLTPQKSHSLQRLRISPIPSTTGYMPGGVRVTCKDTGIGISPENQKKLFQAFEKLELGNKPLTINSTGAGLGLVISNNLVQRLSPKEVTNQECEVIQFVSEENAGTTFYFDVYHRSEKLNPLLDNMDEKIDVSWTSDPGLALMNIEELKREVSKRDLYRELASPLTSPLTSPKIETSAFRPSNLLELKTPATCKCPKILIVDDDTFNLTALDQILAKISYPCDWALNGKEALDKIKTRQTTRCGEICEQYKLMFLDCQMPILNGFETATQLKKMMNDGEVDRLRIVGCTAFVQEADEKKARQSGMDDFCTKPINMNVIKEKVKINLRH